ncbi:hypothetical protein P43SY_003219 [Pythium insidiosum]|uniref:Uncharacterized protein n=1 Tax=Pythium insidiosum TaxID=114742 RepID=A0AAD5LNJ5_PYTIN|nr:hypothetical protein P43SY_003219 [Pythium insidiosum]KAJ0409132.1 hypothetical protein ATCC90586_002843 [Pythium insidiosum]
MPSTLASVAQTVCSKSKNSSTLAVVPLVVASVAIAGYARATANHHRMEGAQDRASQEAHDQEMLHQHIAHPWKGTR